MAISAIQGTLGSGKSAFAVSQLLEHLRAGGVVAANFDLVDGWAETVAGQTFRCKFLGQESHTLAKDYHDRFRVVGSLEGVYQASRELIPRAKGKISKQFEGHGLLVLDEAHLIFNSRRWQRNMSWIEFFSQSRKMLWDVYLISHSVEMIDTQIRNFIEYDVRFRNLNKVKVPFLGFPASRMFCSDNAFVSIWRYYGLGAGSGNILKRNLSFLQLWEAQLYDSMKVFSEDAKTPDYAAAGPDPARPVPERPRALPGICTFFNDVRGLVSPQVGDPLK